MDRYELAELGNTIRRLRVERNMTLAELSDKTGIQMATLSRMENNKMTGTLDAFNAIAEAFGMKLSELFQEYEKDQFESDEIEVMEVFVGAN
jgi:transcriptional regulator with XRE-family HTH domain